MLQEKIVTTNAEIYINEDKILKDDDQDMSTAGTPEFMLAQFFSGVCKLCCTIIICCRPLNICLFVMLCLYIYIT